MRGGRDQGRRARRRRLADSGVCTLGDEVNVDFTRGAKIILTAWPDAQGYRIRAQWNALANVRLEPGERRRLSSRALTVLPDLQD